MIRPGAFIQRWMLAVFVVSGLGRPDGAIAERDRPHQGGRGRAGRAFRSREQGDAAAGRGSAEALADRVECLATLADREMCR